MAGNDDMKTAPAVNFCKLAIEPDRQDFCRIERTRRHHAFQYDRRREFFVNSRIAEIGSDPIDRQPGTRSDDDVGERHNDQNARTASGDMAIFKHVARPCPFFI